MQRASVEHDADAKSVTRTPSAPRKRMSPSYEAPVTELTYSDDPYDSLSSFYYPTPHTSHSSDMFSSLRKCEQPTPVTPVRNNGPTNVKQQDNPHRSERLTEEQLKR